MRAAEAPSLDPGLLDGKSHVLCIGRVEDHDYFKRQHRLTFARVGLIDPLSLDDYRAYGGLIGLERPAPWRLPPSSRKSSPPACGSRGGAGFPAGIKWRTVLEAQGPQKFIVCYVDEGDSGTFADRMLMEGDPFLLIEGMAIAPASPLLLHAASSTSAPNIRYAIATMREAIAIARRADLLQDARFDIEICVRCRRLCLRRGNLAARKHRGQARPSARQAAAAGAQGPVQLPDRDLQCADLGVAGLGILAEGGKAYAEHAHGPFARHLAVPDRRQCRKRGGSFEAPSRS